MKHVNLYDLYKVTIDAGKEILGVYGQDFDVEFKDDDSPLTQADQRAHHSIMKGLKKINSRIPVLSEEGQEIPYEERKDWKEFWLVDPLDGTKEFIKKNGEFTVNIALIEGGYPSVGMIYAPALDTLYFGVIGKGAYKLEKAASAEVMNEEKLLQKSEPLPELRDSSVTRVVASRSHMSDETEAFIKELETKHEVVEVVSSGSSLKFCLVAEGKADYYPRFAPTMEWDTGAGQAIVEATGGKVIRYKDKERFYYNRENLLNGWFLVKS
ncbi:3'(2'),5'-bisphosphate nucleotidase CysQ [Filobacillus milosensis]|uniref:3'(2'),5'-bisphosphate nucleotidase CysQ n=1 Tax=Filobacillus milosensis TaxID=94137 RepID=A0A4Y8IKT2_9BACI|nr:3'(2'),5'-bisphosphate nucleotidase CysQ [Filobacillus milosensis]TFB14189.1 3'(2'),5'-bisphosphate nucleotidase CysQ [Filobacillus milosensis]